MPRRNENARPRAHRAESIGHRGGYQPNGPRFDANNPPQGGSGVPQSIRTYPVFLPVSESPIQNKQRPTGIKTTPEQIVRDFRRNEGFNTYEAAGMMRPLYRKVRRKFFLARWFRAVDWKNVFDWNGKAFNWACWAVLIGCLIYLGLVVFTPFTIKLLR